jgi:DNA-binding GntR family transcriptional regulator
LHVAQLKDVYRMHFDSALDLHGIHTLERATLQTQVYQQLRRLLMMGRFRPGQALKIRDVAASFGTSIQPVREAIRQLMAERALEATPNISARIPRLGPEQLDDLRSVRLAVEGLAAERAAGRIGPEQLAVLENIMSAETEDGDEADVEANVARNLEFHFYLYSLSGSDVLPSIIEGLWLRIGPYIRDAAEAFDARGGRGGAHHTKILDALRKRDLPAVRHAVEEDINHFFELLMDKPQATSISTVTGKRRSATKKPLSQR